MAQRAQIVQGIVLCDNQVGAESRRNRTRHIAEPGKLRGVDSEGMLCSGTELGVSEDMYPGAGYNGLLVLPENAELGADVKPILGLDDYIFDISIVVIKIR